MSERVTMPALGESVTEGTVTRWLKNVGDEVAVDEPLLEVSTDKVDTEIPSPVAGTLQEILAQEDDTVPVGADLAVIGDGPGGGGSAPAEGQSGGEGQDGDSADGQQASDTDAAAREPDQAAPSTDQPMTSETSEPEADQSGQAQQDSAQGDDAKQDSSQQETPQQPADSGGGSADSGGGETVTMPALGESVTEGTVTRWLKAEGDTVEVDEPLLEVSTDKVDTEIPSPVAGVLTKILVAEDDTVPVGGDLAVIGGSASDSSTPDTASEQAEPTAEESSPQQEAPQQEAPQQSAPPQEAAQQSAPPQEAPQQEAPRQSAPPQEAASDGGGDGAAYVTPLVRKLAAQHGVELDSLIGTGIGGRIRKQDVLDAAEATKAPAPEPVAAPVAATASTPAGPSASPKRGTTEKMSRLRKVIAARMVESLQVSAQLTTVVEVDLTKVARLRERAKRDFESREGTKLSYLPFLALAAVEALKAHPNLNSSVTGDEITYHADEHLSIAVDTEKGLIVPVVKNAGDLNIAGLARAIAELADRTRNNRITPDDLAGGTFTITNTGSRGALFDTPIINQPQVAILGTGALVKRPVVVSDVDGGETIAVRSMMYLALSYDHRVVDGADAARFLGTMKTRLEEGRFEASLGL